MNNQTSHGYLHTFNVRPGFNAGHYYVMDRFAHTALAAKVAGPFGRYVDAENYRRQLNIMEDCEIAYCRA